MKQSRDSEAFVSSALRLLVVGFEAFVIGL